MGWFRSNFIQRKINQMPVSCPFANCTATVPKAELAQHKSGCPHAPKPCVWCKAPFPPETLQRHSATCDQRMESCEKCFDRVRRSNRDAHAASDCAKRNLNASSAYDQATMAVRNLLRGQQNTSAEAAEQQRKLSMRLLHYALYDASQRAEEQNCIVLHRGTDTRFVPWQTVRNMTRAAFVDSVKSDQIRFSGIVGFYVYVDRIPQTSPTDGPRFTRVTLLGHDWPSMQFKLKPGSVVGLIDTFGKLFAR
jgi:hypothetical protein